MYQRDQDTPGGRWTPDGPPLVAPAVRARHAVARVREALTDAPPERPFAPGLVREARAVPLADPQQEGERCFALGWLPWLAGEPGPAEPLLARAGELLPA